MKNIKMISFSIISGLLSIALYCLVLFLKPPVTQISHINAATVCFGTFLFLFWAMICINKNIFTAVSFGFRRFIRNTKEKNYFDYLQNKKKVSAYIWRCFLGIAIFYMLLMIILYIRF